MATCRLIGERKTCPDNAQSCMIEIRKRDGKNEQVSESCSANKAHNFQAIAKSLKHK